MTFLVIFVLFWSFSSCITLHENPQGTPTVPGLHRGVHFERIGHLDDNKLVDLNLIKLFKFNSLTSFESWEFLLAIKFGPTFVVFV